MKKKFKVLGIDASGQAVSAAVIDSEKIVCEVVRDVRLDHSTTLLPLIDTVLRGADAELSEMDFLAVTSGPGSFTGLRIGAATVKGLAFCLDKPIIPVPTLAALSYNVINTESLLCPILDARRGQVYSTFYLCQNDEVVAVSDAVCEEIETILEKGRAFGRKMLFLGDGVAAYRSAIEKSCANFAFAPASHSRVKASCVAVAAIDIFCKSDPSSFTSDFRPMYVRKPQAEREADKKLKTLGALPPTPHLTILDP